MRTSTTRYNAVTRGFPAVQSESADMLPVLNRIAQCCTDLLIFSSEPVPDLVPELDREEE
jgi:hypothetical protein